MRADAHTVSRAKRARSLVGALVFSLLGVAQAAPPGHMTIRDALSTTRPYDDDTLTVETTVVPDPARPDWDTRNIEFTSHLEPSTLTNGVSFLTLQFTRAEFRGLQQDLKPPRLTLSNGAEFCPAATNFVTAGYNAGRAFRFVNGLPADIDVSFYVLCNNDGYATVNGALRYSEPALLAPDLVLVRGFSWLDENRNGVRDEPLERRMAGVEIRAIAVDAVPADAAVLAAPRAVTGVDGLYEIWLRPQAYQFVANCPQNFGPTTPKASRHDYDDSDFTTEPNSLNAQGTGPTLVPAGGPQWGPDIGCRSTRNVISGYVWHDQDRDGQRDSFEGTTGTVRLMRYDSATQAWGLFVELEAASDGHFVQEVDPGRWRVEFPAAQPAGGGSSAATARDAGTSDFDDSDLMPDGTTAAVDIAGGGQWNQFDVGFIDRIGAVRGLVWRDLDGNGMAYQEPGVFGVSVSLLRGGTELATAVTDEQGNFRFNHVVEGDNYQIRLNTNIPVENRRRTISPPNAISDDWSDSDLDPLTLKTAYFATPGEGQTLSNLGIGLKAPGLATLQGHVWQDRNANGLRDKGELALSRMTVNVQRRTATGTEWLGYSGISDAKGEYFIDVPAGRNYVLAVVPQTGWNISPPSVNGANDSDVGGLPFDLRVNQTLRRDVGMFQVARTEVPLTDYWPMHVGASWSYGSGSTADFTVRVKSRTRLHGSTVYVVADSRSGSEYLLSLDESGLRLHGLNAVGLDGSRLQGQADAGMIWAPPRLKRSYHANGSARVRGTLTLGRDSQSGEGTLKYRSNSAWTAPIYDAPNPTADLDVSFNASGRVRGADGALSLEIAADMTLRRGIGPTRWRVNGSDSYLIRYSLDPDGDRINADHDNCRATSNKSQVDRDGDGVGDVCDLDDDDDLKLDTADNCPLLANPDQRNRDGDALGDACDPRPGVKQKP